MPPKKSAPEKPSPDASKNAEKPSQKSKSDSEEPPTSAAVRKTPTYPPTTVMVKEALKELDNRKGSSAQAIRAYVLAKYPSVDPVRFKSMLRKALVKGIEGGELVRPANSTGNGAQGRFRLAVRGKAKAPTAKAIENSDPNVEEPSVKPKVKKTKAKGAGSEKPKPVAKKLTAEDLSSTEPPEVAPPSKVAPAKRPKKPVGTKEEVAKPRAGSKARKAKAKAPAKPLEGEDVLAKKPATRGKRVAE